MRPNTESDFWLRVDRGAGHECWPWTGGTNSAGEGVFILRNALHTAHRMAWTLAYGCPPKEKKIIRLCENKLCVNPKHLAMRGDSEHRLVLLLNNVQILPSGCWLWKAATQKDGYGICRAGLAHRISWELHNGPIPSGMNVLHKCDNPPCVYPGHLFLGTQADNVRDMISKGRQNYVGGGPTAGVKHFTPDQIRDIRRHYISGNATQKEIGEAYGVSPSVISRIVNMVWYKSVPV